MRPAAAKTGVTPAGIFGHGARRILVPMRFGRIAFYSVLALLALMLMLRMPAGAAMDGCRDVYAVGHGWHVGIVLSARDFEEKSFFGLPDLARKEWLEFGWGEAEFYQARETGIGLALRAILWSDETVMHVHAFDGDSRANFPSSEVIALRLPEAGYRRLVAHIEEYFTRDASGAPIALGDGLYGVSRFYRAEGTYSLRRTSNVWSARVLEAGGVPIDAANAVTASGLLTQLRDLSVDELCPAAASGS